MIKSRESKHGFSIFVWLKKNTPYNDRKITLEFIGDYIMKKEITFNQAVRHLVLRGIKDGGLNEQVIKGTAGFTMIQAIISKILLKENNSKIVMNSLRTMAINLGGWALMASILNVLNNYKDLRNADKLYLREDGEIEMVTLNKD